jgi:DNA-binding SARP family transcriptional activator
MTAMSVGLLGGFVVKRGGEPLDMPSDARRVIAFLALQRRPVSRVSVAGGLWADSDQSRASGNLRSALWRIRQKSHEIVGSKGETLCLAPEVDVDVERVDETASAIFSGGGAANGPCLSIEPFVNELLPGWQDEWALIERERVRQQALHALEAITTRLTNTGQYPEAIAAALAAIKLDPYRESAHRCLMKTYVSEGNPSEALRHFASYRALLNEELGMDPTPTMLALVDDLRDTSLPPRLEAASARS